jgi:hypothetical protein
MFHRRFVCCRPGGRQGDTEQSVPQWRRPVASGVALDILNEAMLHVLLQRLRMAIETASNGGAIVRCRCLFCLT